MAATMAALLSLVSVFVAGEESLVLPLASRSTLLDIERAGERLVAVGEYGHVLYSDDSGGQWLQARVPSRRMLTAVYFLDSRHGWAVGHDGIILASIDGGESWAIQRDGLLEQRRIDQRALRRLTGELEALRQRLLEADTSARRAALQRSIDELVLDLEDARWRVEQPVVAPPLLDVFFSDKVHGVATGAFNTLLVTGDGGASWQHVPERLDNPDGYHLNAITGDGAGTLWIAAEGGLLFRSADRGASWQSLASPYQGSWFGIVRAPQSGALLVFGLRGSMFRSLDQGDSWQQVGADNRRTLSGGAFVSEQYVVLAGAVGTLLLSEDGGASFRTRALVDRVNLADVSCVGDSLIAVGQGGVHRAPGFGAAP